jgi:hypothetical protein
VSTGVTTQLRFFTRQGKRTMLNFELMRRGGAPRLATRAAAVMMVPALMLLTACPKDNKQARRDSIPVDTTHLDTTTATDLSQIQTNLPAAEPDTFRQRKLTPPQSAGGAAVPAAPSALMEAVQREQSVTRFCYTEFGQKADPRLSGNVAMVVTVGNDGISNATVGDSNWRGTGAAGRAVNNCLNQKAKQAWKLAPGAVKPGRYVVQLSFSGA